MSIKEYEYVTGGDEKCSVCGTTDDVVYDEDGNPICTDCLFEREVQEQMDSEDQELMGY